MRLRSTSGQASVEYVAVVAIVAIVFAVAGSFTLQGRAIAAATVGQLKRGLCIVEGHDCPEEHPPCQVSSASTSDDWQVDIAFVRLGAGRSAIVEHKSDGQILVTLADHMDLGATGGFGANLKIGDKIAFGGEVRAAALASLGHGTTYRVADDRTAGELIRTMRRERTDPRFWQGLQALGSRVSGPVTRYRSIDLSASASLGPLTGAVGGGGSEDLLTGRKTVYLKGSVSLDLQHDLASGGGSLEGKVAVTLDRHDKPVDLMVLGTGNLQASSDLPALLQPVAGHLPAGIDRTWQLEAHLDLTQPGRGKAVLDSLAHPSRLAHMVLDEGTVEVNSYGNQQDVAAVGGHVKVGLSLGGEISHTTASRHLLSAMEHTPEGFWVPRYDCLEAA
jgi:hypothetical protein